MFLIPLTYVADEDDESPLGAHSKSGSQASSAHAHANLNGTSTHDSQIHTETRRLRFNEAPVPTHDETHTLGGTAHNWLARFLHVKPARAVIPLTIPRDHGLKEIYSILRDWRRYGMREVIMDKSAGRITAIVDERNSLGVKPVTLMCEVFPVAMKGRAQGMAIAKFSQQKGAKSSFNQAMSAMKDVLKGRGVLVTKKSWAKEMRKCLADWEAGQV